MQYVERRTGDHAEAQQCVDTVLAALKTRWTTVLSAPSPADRIWDALRVDAALRSSISTRSPADWLHAILQPAQADIVILHHELGVSVERAAHLMGMTSPNGHALLRGAERALGSLFDK
ncbi:hypothetical protein [Streptomyces sp. NPDC001665]